MLRKSILPFITLSLIIVTSQSSNALSLSFSKKQGAEKDLQESLNKLPQQADIEAPLPPSGDEIFAEAIDNTLAAILKCTYPIPDKKIANKHLLNFIEQFFIQLQGYPIDSQLGYLLQLDARLQLCRTLENSDIEILWKKVLEFWLKVSKKKEEVKAETNKQSATEVLAFLKGLANHLAQNCDTATKNRKSLDQEFFYSGLFDFWIPNITIFKKVVGIDEKETNTDEATTKDLADHLMIIIVTSINKINWKSENAIHAFNDFCNFLNLLYASVQTDLAVWEHSFISARSMIVGKFSNFVGEHFNSISHLLLENWINSINRGELNFIFGEEPRLGVSFKKQLLSFLNACLEATSQPNKKIDKIKKGTRVL